jgi:hypothetical protein
MLIYSFGELRGYQSSSGWLTAQGEVISSKVIERDAGRSGTRYRLQLDYSREISATLLPQTRAWIAAQLKGI